VIAKKGAWFSWMGPNGEIRGQGLQTFRDTLANTQGALMFLFNQVKDSLTGAKTADTATAKPIVSKGVQSENLDDLFSDVEELDEDFGDDI